ncbi:hypothetical protein HK104_004145 [Borealophlyctis nickersoniae]|nr:hypothetical protein HK104_004145 [Borealophlyctis nickersoniae]
MGIHGLPINAAQARSAAGAPSSPTTPSAGAPPNTPLGPPNTPVGSIPVRVTTQTTMSTSASYVRSSNTSTPPSGKPPLSPDALPAYAHDLLPKTEDVDLSRYTNLAGFVSLVVTPFFQGMFYGLGEGAAKVFIGRWFGVEPSIALGGVPPAARRGLRQAPSEVVMAGSCGDIADLEFARQQARSASTLLPAGESGGGQSTNHVQLETGVGASRSSGGLRDLLEPERATSGVVVGV